ncbi:hypothetical protein HOLleu_00451 [Holothuria leucospilota]|uniref:BRCT domain-containing protein n=1 Tax=Holothuria leucospilota TaxID=206669 RepID=A0A9Q1HFV0_HOLLE|nr:hypothetical protein HOLleu_00451 [Holothuria leucospilota]
MVDGKNPQNPPFVVHEEFLLYNVEYQLTGAVVMRPDHFFNVVKVGEQYALINGYPPMEDMHHYPKMFTSFSGAFRKDETDVSLTYTTDPANATGVHVLLYHCKEHNIEVSLMSVPNLFVDENNLGESSVDNQNCSKELLPEYGKSCSTKQMDSASQRNSPTAIPKIDGQSYSHVSLKALVESASGKIKDKLPSGNTSTKKYVVLVNPNATSKKNLSSEVRLALKAGYPVLDFSFVTNCLKEHQLLDMSKFMVDFSNHSQKFQSQPTLESKHFRRTPVMGFVYTLVLPTETFYEA